MVGPGNVHFGPAIPCRGYFKSLKATYAVHTLFQECGAFIAGQSASQDTSTFQGFRMAARHLQKLRTAQKVELEAVDSDASEEAASSRKAAPFNPFDLLSDEEVTRRLGWQS